MDLAKASADDFRPLIDESFTIDVEDAEPLTLTEVETKPGGREAAREPFALVFRAAGDVMLPQQIYRLEHAATGALEIFLVPISRGEDHVLYEAVFT